MTVPFPTLESLTTALDIFADQNKLSPACLFDIFVLGVICAREQMPGMSGLGSPSVQWGVVTAEAKAGA